MTTMNEIQQAKKSAERSQRIRTVITYTLLVLWGLIVLFPFYWMILTSLKSYSAYNSEYIPKLYTTAPTFQNYADAFTAVPLARYFGNTVYFVTFRNTDPLFTADLTDPDAPRLTGELKVSGFSSYLHPFGEGLLLGIGYEANEETGVTTGLKLSVFDVSDPVNVREISRYVMDGVTWCPAIEDYKAIYAEADRRLAGFYLENRYLLFGYDAENGITRKLLYDFFDDMVNGREDYNTMRAVRIGDEMYLAGGSFITGFAMGADGSFAKNLVLQF